MRTVLLDVDGVIADFATPFHALAEEVLRRTLPPPAEWKYHHSETSMGLSEHETKSVLFAARDLHWAESIGLYPGAKKGVLKLLGMADIVFVTAPWEHHPTWCHARRKLLREHFPGVDVIHTAAKHRVKGDFLVEDNATCLIRGGPWTGLLYRRPWNESVTYNTVYDWEDVYGRITAT